MTLTIQDILIRFFLAVLIGGVIGYEREVNHRAAGFRTHILVCIGATLISLIQINIGNKAIELIDMNKELANVIKLDYGRLGAQVITGVGFIGAGTIMHNKGNIKGLTTAATLWVVACLGLAIGMGDYLISLVGAIFIVVTLVFLKRIEYRFIEKIIIKKIEIQYFKSYTTQVFIEKCFEEEMISIKSIEFSCEEEDYQLMINNKIVKVIYRVNKPLYVDINKCINKISENDNILMIKEINNEDD
ncbi:MgtC/SapB family protein [Clostridium carnis]